MKRLAMLLLLAACPGHAPAADGIDALLERPKGIELPALDDPMEGGRIRISLSPTVLLDATRSKLDARGPKDFSWFGRTPSNGVVVISSKGDEVVGTIIEKGETYRIAKASHGRFQISRVKRPKILPHHGDAWKHGIAPVEVPEDGPIEIIVAYTSEAAKSCKPISATIQNAVDLTNVIAENTGLTTSFHLAYSYEDKTFRESRYTMRNAVTLFAGRDDKELTRIHELRDEHNADIAVLFVHSNGTVYDGVSMQTTATTEDTAFSVVNCESAAVYTSLAHEIGHLLGLNDDWDRPDTSTFAYGYGLAHDSDQADDRWRTVMTSPGACTNDCPRILYWSNPAVMYQGDPTGTSSTSDNARVIKKTAGAISRFRPRPH